MEKDFSKYDDSYSPSLVGRTLNFLLKCIDRPITWFRESIIDTNPNEYYWYHEHMKRVPTVDECYEDDLVCRYEAERQFKLDRRIDDYILLILKKRYEMCKIDYSKDPSQCDHLKEILDKNQDNYFIKYGYLGVNLNAFYCYMKQKHRMAWERRHGPVGSGKKEEKIVRVQKPTC